MKTVVLGQGGQDVLTLQVRTVRQDCFVARSMAEQIEDVQNQ